MVPVRGGLLVMVLGLGTAPGSGQGQTPAPVEAPPAGSRAAADLSTRYQFEALQGSSSEKGQAGETGQYRVATRDTIRVVDEVPQGAPERRETTEQTIYSERPAEPGGAGKAVVRHYEAYRGPTDPSAKPSRRSLLEGLTIWYEPRSEGAPRVLSLTEGRGLRVDEYQAIVVRQVFLPELRTILPSSAVRVGDRWTISRDGTRVLLGVAPARGEPLAGTLVEVRQAAQGPNWEAVLSVSGRVRLPHGDTAVNAQMTFAFPPPGEAGARPAEGDALVQARGSVSELRMASTSVSPQGPNSRLRQMVTRELVLGCQMGDQGRPLTVPPSPPEETEENSWLVYDDPQGKFHFRYPQEFRMLQAPDEFSVELLRPRPGGRDILELLLIVKTGEAEVDRMNRDPNFQLKVVKQEWEERGFSMVAGPQKWLPEADWNPLKRKVFRAEQVALSKAKTPGTKDVRVHCDLYLVLFGKDDSLMVRTMTSQDPPTAYRQQVEAVLKSFDFGPSPAAVK